MPRKTRTGDMAWARPPQQERSQQTLDRLLDAVESLFADDTIDSVSVADIAKRAGHSVGAFYSRFPNKEAAVHAVHARFCEEAKATADEVLRPARWHDSPMREVTRQVVGFLAADYRQRQGLRRALLLLNGGDPEIRARSKDVSGHVTARIHGLLADHAAELSHPDLLVAAEMVHRLLFSTLDHWALFDGGASTGRTLPQETFVEELAGAVCAYLGTPRQS